MHRGRRRHTDSGIHGRDRHQIAGYVLPDLLGDIDGLSLVAECRQYLDNASKEYVARYQKKIEHQDSRKQAIEYGARPCEECARQAKIAANRDDRALARWSFRNLLGLFDELVKRVDWPSDNLQMRLQARYSLGQPLSGAVKDGRFSGGAAATICSEAQAEEARNKDYDDHDADDVENVHGTLRSRDGNTTVTTPPRYRRERAAQSPIVASQWGDDRTNLRLGIYPSWSILLAFNRTLPERHEDAPAVAGWEGGSCAANCFRPPALESQLDASRRRGCRAADRDFT